MGKGKKKNRVHIIPIRTDNIPRAIVQALRELKQFSGIDSIGEPAQMKNGWGIETVFSVPLPNRSAAAGVSATGVKASEEVFFWFPEDYPRKEPAIFLRPNFPRNLPHIFPGSQHKPVRPCIYDGPLDDLLHQGTGLFGVLEHLQSWLKKAASNSLIDSRQGWEPIRYDSADTLFFYDLARIRGLVTEKAGCHFLICKSWNDGGNPIYTFDDYAPKPMDGRYIYNITRKDIEFDGGKIGKRPVLFCWPDKDTIVGEYFPETVTNLGELRDKSKTYGTYSSFWDQIQYLWHKLGELSNVIEVMVIHCVRRPLQLINQNTDLELLAYRVRVKFGLFGAADMDSPVDIACHVHTVSPEILKEMSGSSSAQMESIIHIGCGSLGSKIAMHLCRAGHGPFTLIDDKYMSEHNLARHALSRIAGNKAELLKKEIDNFRIGADFYPKSIQDFLSKSDNRLFHKNSLIIDSTASISVRETLASLPLPNNDSRILQTGLYSEGKIGFLSIEGKGRNPRVDDLSTAMFDSAIDNRAVADALKGAEGALRRHATGQGCGSYTMVIPDTKISMYAAAMAERARKAYEGDIRDDGEISLGFMSESGMSLTWETISLGKTRIVKLDNKDWELRVLDSAYQAMGAEVQKYPSVETGGVLIGRLCPARRCAIITRALEAPPDSVRTSGRFELGIEGLVDKVTVINETSRLTYLGTWHSHLNGSTPSGIDEATLCRIKELRLGIPAFNLIWHNSGLTCFADYGDY